jgi:hypothetical protein
MNEPQNDTVATDVHERAEAALGWIDEDATASVSAKPEWAEQACEELSAASVTGMLLRGRRRAD